MKRYFHKKFLGPIIFFGVCASLAITNVKLQGLHIVNFLLVVSSLGFVVLGLLSLWIFRKSKESLPVKQRNLKAQFEGSTIHFPEGYYFKQSSLKAEGSISTDIINEVNLFTYPPSIVVNSSEVIFLGYDQSEDLEKFAKNNNLECVDRLDIWEYLNRPFLDTEFSEQEKKVTVQSLLDNGLTQLEIESIRRKIKRIMWRYTMGMEWVYLGQFDYLRLTFLTKKKYWWTMEIALKNFKKSRSNTV